MVPKLNLGAGAKMFGLGKRRTALGKWLDRNGFTQEDLVNEANLNRDTVSKACSDVNYIPSGKTMKKILNAVRKYDSEISAEDFWNL
jgi:transcriptional regulator with XRE-family HTH domain